MDLFKKTLVPVTQVLQDGDVEIDEVDELVLVGGSTRIPKVRQMLSAMFGEKQPATGVNPDEAVAYGASVQGGILSGEAAEATKGLLLIDVTPLTLGKEVKGGIMSRVIPRNTVIPCKKSKDYTTTKDFQTRMHVSVFEGERSMVKDNHLIGEFILDGLPPAPKGVPSVEVTFEIDVNGILQVTAQDKATKKMEKITITAEKGRLSEDEIERMVREAEQFAEEDKKVKGRVDAKNALESYLYSLPSAVEDIEATTGQSVSMEDREELQEVVHRALLWLDDNPDKDAEEYLNKQKEVERAANPIIRELYEAATGGGGSASGGDGGERRRRGRNGRGDDTDDDPDL